MRRHIKLKARLLAALLAAAVLLPSAGAPSFAAIKDATVFQDVNWEYLGETATIKETGWLQSMCCTEDYIICLENTSNSNSNPDTLLAFYKNDHDKDGNPVKKYSLAKKITETDYEHGNGMTYNPNTKEIMIVGSKPLKSENKGLVYVVDAESLKLKRTVKISSTYNLLGIAYCPETDRYIIQLFDDDYTNSFFIVTDSAFKLIDDAGFNTKMWNNIRHQDFCVSGDYLISLAFTKDVHNSNVMHIYSISERRLLTEYALNINGTGEFIEPESICEMGPDEIIVANAQKNPRRISFYKAKVAAAFKVSTSVENGTISSSQKSVDYGTDFSVNYEPQENYELDKITVDGQEIDVNEYPNTYVFEKVAKNHSIDVRFKEKPKFTLTTSVQNGTIDESPVVYRDTDCTIKFTPDKHFEIDQILIDGEPAEALATQTEYTFTNIQEAHTIDVRFKEIPSYEITAQVSGGTVQAPDHKVYRDESYTVVYSPNNQYTLGYIVVDGKTLYGSALKDYLSGYTFENIQGAHHIQVVYYWKYLPLVILTALFVSILLSIQIARLNPAGRKRRMLRKRYKRRKKIRKKVAQDREKYEAIVREKMKREEEKTNSRKK